MYRSSDIKLFRGLSIVSNTLAVLTVMVCFVYLIIQSHYLYRDLALILLAFSIFFRTQIFVYKFNIIEKRLLHMIPVSMQHFEVGSRRANIMLIVYFVLFLLALFSVIFCFLEGSQYPSRPF